MPIYVYRCGCGHRFERLVPRDAEAPACPQCGERTRKIPAGPSLGRGAAAGPDVGARSGGDRQGGPSVPIPWRGVVRGGPEKLQREIAFRQGLEEKARAGLRTPGGPEREAPGAGGSAGTPEPPASA